MSAASLPTISVVAGVLSDASGRVLICERPAGSPMAGYWEFPGGKLETGEGQLHGLRRELGEELGIVLREARPLIQISHDYPDRRVRLAVWRVTAFDGAVRGLDGQQIAWVAAEELDAWRLLPADRPVVTALRLPDCYAVTAPGGSTRRLLADLQETLTTRRWRLLQLRRPGVDLADCAAAAAELCRRRAARLLLNGEPRMALALARQVGAAGIHVPARHLQGLAGLDRAGLLVGASCHDAAQIAAAQAAGADFAVLGPVAATQSHPHGRPLGWSGFARLAASCGLPVYAIGGQQPRHLAEAWAAGAQGVAGIRGFWDAARAAGD